MPYNLEYRIVWPDDSIHWVAVRGKPHHDETGKVVRMSGIVVDITERKQVEEELRESEERFRLLAETSHDLITLADSDANAIWVNAAWKKVFGEELENRKNPFKLLHPDDLEKVSDAWSELVANNTEMINIEYRFKCGSGDYLSFESSVYSINVGSENLYYVIARDITERKRIEEALREKEEKYRRLVNLTQEGIWVIDQDSVTTFVNPSMARMMGYSPDEMAGKHLFSFMDEHGVEIATDFIERRKRNIAEQHDFEFIRKDGGRITVTVVTTPLYDIDGNYAGAIAGMIDITEQQQKARELETYRLQLRSLASTLSFAEERERRRIAVELHDSLGQSLAMVKMKLGARLASTVSEDPNGEMQEIRYLVDDMIRRTRSLTFELSPPILYELGLEAALEWLTEDIQKAHRLRCVFKCDGRTVPMDDDLAAFLFSSTRELLLNVVKHAQAGQADVSIQQDNHTISVVVADDGAGFTYKPEVSSSSGFGLFSIRERLAHLGGYLKVESESGHGARVTLVLPPDEGDE